MSARFDNYDNSLVIEGWEQGIADSPYSGLSDIRNVNIISVPGETSVNFATAKVSSPVISQGTVVSADATADTITFTGASGLEQGMAVVFAGGSLPAGIVAGTVYWVGSVVAGVCKLNTVYNLLTPSYLNITSTGTGTFQVYTVGLGPGGSPNSPPKYFAYDADDLCYFMLDGLGQLWSNLFTTASGYWTYVGSSGSADSGGTGLVYYRASDGTRWVFVFKNNTIDYFDLVSLTWTYGWKPLTGAIHQTNYLRQTSGIHEAMVAPDSRVYYCDGQYIGRWYQTDPATAFVPTNLATYTFDETALLPTTDVAQCLAFLGTSLMVGGKNNVIYPWNRFDTNFSYPILLAESNIQKMVTVNTNTYCLVGNRGRIYITNGTNAQLYKKIPDHISGTMEPYFIWGGLISFKNQLYFSVKATTNAGVAIPQYGGVWAIDTDTKALRLTNKLSYGTYAGYAPALIANYLTTPAGTGLFIGWDSDSFTYGIDNTVSTPYTSSSAVIDSDLIPIGTYNKPRDFTMIEYKLTRPMVSGESILIKTRLIFNTTDTGYTTTLTDSTAGNFSNSAPINFKNAQWMQFQIVLNSTASSPSYVRLKHIRILGLSGSPSELNTKETTI
jgi:hypothetical protein